MVICFASRRNNVVWERDMEKRFTLSHEGMEIPCRLCEPDCGFARRFIIGVHGFCGSKDSLVLESIAEEMGLFEAAMVRFDFPAHGENPMSDRELTLDNCLKTLTAVAHWAAQTYPGIQKCIFATGFGAFLTVLALEELQEVLGDIRLVMQTPDFRMADSLLAMKNLTQEQFYKQGRVTVGRPGDRKVEVPYSFYLELRGAVAYNSYGMPMLLLHGECDEVVKLTDVMHFRRINDMAKLVVIPGADHQFRGEGQWDMVVDLTRDWFECEQVLLCDYE